MKRIIGKLFARLRQKLFAARVNREIFHKIFPHLNHEADHGYPFSSDDELVGAHVKKNLAAQSTLRLIDLAASKMPKAEGDAFRYIAFRDLNKRMWMYLEFAAERVQPRTCDPRFVATRAPA